MAAKKTCLGDKMELKLDASHCSKDAAHSDVKTENAPAVVHASLHRKDDRRNLELRDVTKKSDFKLLFVSFVVVAAIIIGMSVAVFKMINTAGNDQDVKDQQTNTLLENLKKELARMINDDNVNDQQTKTILENFEKNLTSVMNKALNRVTIDGWYLASDGLLYKLFTDKANYTTAKSRCVNFGGILLTKGLRSVSVFREIRENVLEIPKSWTDWPWIGYYEVAENNWQWLDEGANNTEVVVWKEGEPNNNGGINEACANIAKMHQSKVEINDGRCASRNPFVCER